MQTQIRTTCRVLLAAGLLGSGCATSGSNNQPTVRFHEQVSEGLPASHVLRVTIPKTGLRLTIDPNPALTERNIQHAALVTNAGGAAVMIQFDVHGTILLDELTTRGRGHYLVVMLNGQPTAAWLIDQRLPLGQFLLEGDFTDEQAQKLVAGLNNIARSQSTW